MPRPTDYEPKFAEIAYELLCEGASIAEVGWHLRRSPQTISEWRKRFPEFDEAIKTGASIAKGFWEYHGRANIHNKDFNSTLWYMNMKNRWGWVDKQEVKQESTVKVSMEVAEALDFIDRHKQDV